MMYLENGTYIITQVRSPTEFYGYSQARAPELKSLFDDLANYYDKMQNDSALSLTRFIEGAVCVVQYDGKYHRVIIK